MSSQPKGWKEIPLGGACWKSSTDYKTGDWRSYKPIWNADKCVRCMLCHIYCPEGADSMVFDYDFCKGCGICANECLAEAIEMVIEGKE